MHIDDLIIKDGIQNRVNYQPERSHPKHAENLYKEPSSFALARAGYNISQIDRDPSIFRTNFRAKPR